MEEVRVKDALGGKGYNQKFEWPINFASEEKKSRSAHSAPLLLAMGTKKMPDFTNCSGANDHSFFVLK